MHIQSNKPERCYRLTLKGVEILIYSIIDGWVVLVVVVLVSLGGG